MNFKIAYLNYCLRFLEVLLIGLILKLIKKTNLFKSKKPKLIKKTISLLKEGFPRNFVAPSFYLLSYAEFIKFTAEGNESFLPEYKRLLKQDLKRFLSEKNQMIEESIK